MRYVASVHSAIRAQSADLNLGSENVDLLMVQHFAREIETGFQVDISVDSKTLFPSQVTLKRVQEGLICSSESTKEMIWKDAEMLIRSTWNEFVEMTMDLMQKCVAHVSR